MFEKTKNDLFLILITNIFLQNIILSLEDRDAEELILVLCGYYRLLTDRELEVIQEKSRWSEEQGKNNYYMNKKIQYIFQIVSFIVYSFFQQYVRNWKVFLITFI